MIKVYRTKPVYVQAIKWSGTNFEVIKQWSHNFTTIHKVENLQLIIESLHGELTVEAGDWIIRNDKGETSVCTVEEFIKKYEEVHLP